MGRDAGSRDSGEGCTESPVTCLAAVKTSGGPKPGRREGNAGVRHPCPNNPCFAGTLVHIPVTHLFLHDPGQVTSLGSLSPSFLIQKNVHDKRYYFLGLYCSSGQATKTHFFPLESSQKSLPLPGFTMRPPTVSVSLLGDLKGPETSPKQVDCQPRKIPQREVCCFPRDYGFLMNL